MASFPFYTMDDFSFSGKTVYLRIDINSPMNPVSGEILDDTRFHFYLDTIQELENSKVVIVSHQGRPGDNDFTGLRLHSDRLSKIIGRNVKFIDALFGSQVKKEISSMKNGDILMLENSRFYSEEVAIKFDDETMANTNIVKALSGLFDYYIIDAFATVHRPQTTLTGFKHIAPNIAGRLMESEIKHIDEFKMSELKPKIAVLGGAKISDAIKSSKLFMEKNIVDDIILGGVAGNIFLWASGFDIGKRNKEFIIKQNRQYETLLADCSDILSRYKEHIILPEDFILNPSQRLIGISDKVPSDELLADIGMKTVNKFSSIIKNAGSIFLNGPMGMYEIGEYSIGTREIFNYIAASGAKKIVGGGHTINAINNFGLKNDMGYISTGGGALINYLSGDSIPVIDSLIESKKIFGGN
ncbi:MAG: phosphoglycerate kinase [Ferroplasma sp.]